MRQGWVLSGVLLVALLSVGGLWLLPGQDPRRALTSFGKGRQGYAAAHALLTELGYPVRRSYARTSELPTTATVWFVRPFFLEPRAADSEARGLASPGLREGVGRGRRI